MNSHLKTSKFFENSVPKWQKLHFPERTKFVFKTGVREAPPRSRSAIELPQQIILPKILPNSDVKFFFICNLDVASKRRYKELKKDNPYLKLKDIKKALRIRNISDIKRKNSPSCALEHSAP